MHDFDFWRTLAISIAALGQALFVLLYVTFPWWRSFLGRALFLKAVSLAALLNIGLVGRTYDWHFEDHTFIVLYLTMAAGIWIQFIAFLRVRWGHVTLEVKDND